MRDPALFRLPGTPFLPRALGPERSLSPSKKVGLPDYPLPTLWGRLRLGT